MVTETAIDLIEKQDWLDKAGETLQPAIVEAFKAGGATGQEIKNALHGKWLGHPLHPVITDVPLGAWTTALALDALEALGGRKEFAPGADAAIAVGLVGAVGSAVTGLTDWSATTGQKRKIGLAHGLLNVTGTLLYATSLLLRRGKKRGAGMGVAALGYAVTGAAAYLGGHLVYGEQVGVDHTATAQEYPHRYVPVMAEADLPENKLTRVEAKGVPVLLVRREERIYAIAETCSHLGGPLAEGKLEGDTVRCPWHHSSFSLEDGSVVDSPATAPQPCFEVRVQNGQIEVRAADK